MGRTICGASGLAALLLLAGCGDMAGFEGVTEEFHNSYNMTQGGHLDLNNRNGSVEITGWDRSSVEVSGTKYAPDSERLKEIKVDIRQDGDRLEIRTQTPENKWPSGNYGVRYRIHVPRQITLDQVETTNGTVTAENLDGGGKIKSTNGKLIGTRLKGDYHLETTNGSVELDDASGTEHVQTTNGAIRGQLKQGNIDAHTTNGSIDLTLMNPQSEKPVRLDTTNGSIKLAMAEFHGNPVHVETTHGSVTLRLPKDVNGNLRAETSLAKVSSDLALTSTDDESKHALRGKLGSGGPAIEANTTTGAIHIERY